MQGMTSKYQTKAICFYRIAVHREGEVDLVNGLIKLLFVVILMQKEKWHTMNNMVNHLERNFENKSYLK